MEPRVLLLLLWSQELAIRHYPEPDESCLRFNKEMGQEVGREVVRKDKLNEGASKERGQS
jgi:hypothetical protein